MSYYFLAALLPPLHFDQKPMLSFAELRQLMEERLSVDDCKQWHKILLWFDLHNMRLLWKDRSAAFDVHAIYHSKGSLEEAIKEQKLPLYVTEFLQRYTSSKTRLQHFSQLLVLFFQNESRSKNPFLQKFFSFEREWRLILLGLRAHVLQRDLSLELEFEDPHDSLVAQLLAQKDSMHYDPPTDEAILRSIIQQEQSSSLPPMRLYYELARYRFQKIEQLATEQIFSLDAILRYTAQLIVLEQWLALDKKQGPLIAENLLRNVI